MKVAVIGSRTIIVDNLEEYLPEETTEIVSGGARGVDSCARYYAKQNCLKLTEFLPEYEIYGKGAPIKRNYQIVDYSDLLGNREPNTRRFKKADFVLYCVKIFGIRKVFLQIYALSKPKSALFKLLRA